MSTPRIIETEHAKLYGEAWVFKPIPCSTGALHGQPSGAAVQPLVCGAFTADYAVHFDARGALDAPESVPSGSVRAQDFVGEPGRLLIGHVWREGARS